MLFRVLKLDIQRYCVVSLRQHGFLFRLTDFNLLHVGELVACCQCQSTVSHLFLAQCFSVFIVSCFIILLPCACQIIIEQSCSVSTNVTSALEVFLKRYALNKFMFYLFTYLLTYIFTLKHTNYLYVQIERALSKQ